MQPLTEAEIQMLSDFIYWRDLPANPDEKMLASLVARDYIRIGRNGRPFTTQRGGAAIPWEIREKRGWII